ncbi:hypothetical protein [Sandarakinorhabdus oryzae]|uniref:hypothetical protein n=1 Tax=Sandarakinorhabdus oryzae TaxID=2675220 RepID=UPI001F1F1ECB|nr:hypothetical protein [Sandarakinorhabdus oryzae]
MASTVPTGPEAAIAASPSPLRHFDWIWRVRGEVDLPEDQSADVALDRLTPLFHATGTSHERGPATLYFTKKDPAAQDRMAIYNAGLLQVDEVPGRRVLRYELTSHALLACFLAPLLFIAFGQLAITAETYQRAQAEAAEKAEKAKKKDAKADKKKDEAKEFPRNPIDVALGAPPPKSKKEIKAEKEKKKKEPPSATPAWVFAGIFALLYLIGRFLEARLVNRLFARTLRAPS